MEEEVTLSHKYLQAIPFIDQLSFSKMMENDPARYEADEYCPDQLPGFQFLLGIIPLAFCGKINKCYLLKGSVMAKSYFAILGISSGATGDEVRSAYLRLAKEFHPDHYAGGSERFQEVQEAYSVLGNRRRRREYEQSIRRVSPKTAYRRPGYPAPEPLIPEESPVDLGDVSPVRSFQSFTPSFDEIFDWLWSNYSSLEQPKSGRVKNLTLEVTLTPDQALRGGNARIMVPAQADCPSCRGHGGVGFYECTRCAGEGVISGEMPVSVSFPPGLVRDHAVMIPLDRFGIRNVHVTVLFRPTD